MRHKPILEAHLLDFDGDLYGRELVVRLEHGAAGEQRVGSLDALARNIADEVASVRAYFTACQVLVGADVRAFLDRDDRCRPGVRTQEATALALVLVVPHRRRMDTDAVAIRRSVRPRPP